jgi:RNA polymerase sigma factor (sigma-70 family)
MADDLGSSHVRTGFGELSDAELVRATRQGSRRAYAALWKRHSVAALKYAKTLSVSDADDVVSEAFLKVYAAIKAGRGPEEDFRFYIRSAVRNTYVSMVRASRSAPVGEAIEDVVGDGGAELASVRSFDDSATVRAFLSLPARWQEVLWYTEVEGLSRERTAAALGMNPNAVSALSFRAREALRTAWLQEHISTRSDLDRGCGAITPLLGAYSRRGLSRRDRLRVEHHVNGCAHCTAVVGELSELLTPGRLALVLLPVALAGGGLGALASKVGGGSAVLASASTIVTPTATVVATVGGSAASGVATLSVVGKVAACALVATMIVPPTQLLLEAAHHSDRAAESASAHAAAAPGLDSVLHVELVSGTDQVGAPPAPVAPVVPDDDPSPDLRGDGGPRAGEAERGGEMAFERGGADNANLGVAANPNAGGARDGFASSSVGATRVAAEKQNMKADGGAPATELASPAPNGKANANAGDSPGAQATAADTQPATAARANAGGSTSAAANGGVKTTADPALGASPRDTANAGGNAEAAGNGNAGGAAAPGPSDRANENAAGSPGAPSENGGGAANANAGGQNDNAGGTSSGNAGGASSGNAGGQNENAVGPDGSAPTAEALAKDSDPGAPARGAGMPQPAAAGLAVAAEASAG